MLGVLLLFLSIIYELQLHVCNTQIVRNFYENAVQNLTDMFINTMGRIAHKRDLNIEVSV